METAQKINVKSYLCVIGKIRNEMSTAKEIERKS